MSELNSDVLFGKLLQGSFITTTNANPDYYVKVEFKTLKQAQALGEFLGLQWRNHQRTKPAKRKERR